MFMSKLVKNGKVEHDNWKTLHLAADDTPHGVRLPVGPVLVPLSVWKARKAELIRREYEHGWPLGIWLAADESPAAIEQDLDDFTVIAVQFDKYDDGNSYLTARLLRERYGYRSELRAIGDVPGSKLAYLNQIGFDAIASSTKGKFIGALANLADITPSRPRLVAAV
jgi:uncharacterized protein (DUF934 family)